MKSDVLFDKLMRAREKLWNEQERRKYFPNINIVINNYFWFNFKNKVCNYASQDIPKPYLKCSLPPDMLGELLSRKAHWNNLELGCHIMFDRNPNEYMHDVHLLLSYFHT
jgi:hypothetical protein